MTGMSHAECAKQIKWFARRNYRKLGASFAASLDVDDFEQELWITWVTAKEKFNPDLGFKFSTFLNTCMENRLSGMRRNRNVAKRRATEVSLSTPIGEEDSTLLDVIDSGEESPENTLLRKERARVIAGKLPSVFQQMLLILSTPSAEIDKEVKASRAKAEFAASIGITKLPPSRLSLSMLDKLFGVSRNFRSVRFVELQEAIDRYDN